MYLQLPVPAFLALFPKYNTMLAPMLPLLLSDSRYVVRYRFNPEAIEFGFLSDSWHIK